MEQSTEMMYTEQQAAEVLSISVTTLRKQRYRVANGNAKKYVRWIKKGGRVMYPHSACMEYLRDEW